MTENRMLNYDHIVVDVEGIYIDGEKINAYAVDSGVIVNHGGGDEASPSITLAIKADLITVSDRLKAFAADNPGSLTEVGGTDLTRLTARIDSDIRTLAQQTRLPACPDTGCDLPALQCAINRMHEEMRQAMR